MERFQPVSEIRPQHPVAATIWPMSSTGPQDPERWQALERIFAHAVDLDERARSAYLDEACGVDADLRAQVEALFGGGMSSGTSDEDSENVGKDDPADEARRGLDELFGKSGSD